MGVIIFRKSEKTWKKKRIGNMLKLKLKNVSFFFLFTKGMTRPNQKIFSKNKKKINGFVG